jgi:plastocyanin
MKRRAISGVAIAALSIGIIIGAAITYSLASTFASGSTKTTTTVSTTTLITSRTETVTSTLTLTNTRTSSLGIAYVSLIPGGALNQSSNGYKPERITLVLGVNNTVLWANNDKFAHTVSSSVSAEPFNSGNLDPGQTFTYTFTKPGTYPYFCAYHGWMRGTVVVKS